MVDIIAPCAHLVELAAIGPCDDIEPGAPVADLIERREHLGDHRRVLQQGVNRAPDFHPAGRLGKRSHQHRGIERGIPVRGLAPEPAILGHGLMKSKPSSSASFATARL
jgi:hypothetical protein